MIKKFWGPIGESYSENDGIISFLKVMVFWGPQGAGKSSVAKLYSLFSWLEKALVRGDFTEKNLTGYNRFVNNYCAHQNIQYYFRPKTFMHFKGSAYDLVYERGKLSVKKYEENSYYRPMYFISVDKNIVIRKDNGDLDSTCDGMIFIPETREISFVELKNYRVGGAIADAENQLLSTISYFLANHNYEDFHTRRAYLCNPHHPNFAFSARERISEFRKKTHFRLMPQASIWL